MRTKFVAAAMLVMQAGCDNPSPATTAETPPPEVQAAAAPAEPAHMNFSAGKTVLELKNETLDAAWAPGASHQTAGILEGKSWGSFTGQGDSSVGVAKVEFALPAGATALGVPVSVGPGLQDLTVQVVDTASGVVLASFTPSEDYKSWGVWSVDLPGGATPNTITIVGDDKGADWGEWIAFGNPFVR